MSSHQHDVLAAFGEVILGIDRSRRISFVLGDTPRFFGVPPQALEQQASTRLLEYAAHEAVDGLYWAIEAAFEQYVPRHFLPRFLPFREDDIAEFVVLDPEHIALRFYPSDARTIETLLYNDLRLALSSVIGFTDVTLKNIGGPLTDIQAEDLKVVHDNGQFALNMVEDWYHNWIVPRLSAPVPAPLQSLLALEPEDLPRRRLAAHNLTIEYKFPVEVMVYSNGCIRTALINLIRFLPSYLQKHSTIEIAIQVKDPLVEVYVTYRTADNTLKTLQRIDSTGISERRLIKRSSRLRNIVASLHAQLSPYGGSAWALPTENHSLASIVMTVPLWYGPATRM